MMKRDLPSVVLAGLLLGGGEIAWVLARAGDLFLSSSERVVYALTALAAIGCAVLAMSALVAFVTRERVFRWAAVALALGAASISARLAWLVSAGRRVRELALRPYAVALVSVIAGLLCFLLLRAVAARDRTSPQRQRMLALALASCCAVLAALDVSLLPRGYPPFHHGLELALLLVASSAALIAPPVAMERMARLLRYLAPLLALAAPFALAHLAAHPTAGFAVREHAPWTSKLMPPLARRASGSATAGEARQVDAVRRGVDLRDRDVLLITVDALRADVLRAYGGSGQAPVMDALAAEGALFLRAYTPAPHTSYALASLLTAKFVKPLVELGGKLGDPTTLPDRLRRYGYRTAAFYPPAIFFVDGESFAPLARRGFGFEYRKEMFASAAERVEQVGDYLDHAERRPLFVWVHLFEPHEPYDPPADIAHDGSERGRYLAEVRACDRAIGALISRFRAARPNATVILTADHGEEFGEHGGSFHGSSLYDEQVRVPLVWSSPGAVAPRTIGAPVELTDVGTTILSTAGVPRDAHMRGDDLAGLLLGSDEGAPPYAFASIETQHMATDGRNKAICAPDQPHCALFDLTLDPRETRNLVAREPQKAAELRAALDRFLASVPRVEAVAVSKGVRYPEALARVKLGAANDPEELVPLLDDRRTPVRAEAARALGASSLKRARELLDRVRRDDPDPDVRAEAAIAALRHGEEGALPDVLALLGAQSTDRALARRAALAAATRSELALPLLAELATDETAKESERIEAVRALGASKSPRALEPLLTALRSVRLRETVAFALAELGDVRALAPLRAELAVERYPPARRAELLALSRLGEPGVTALLRDALGRESSVPHGVQQLMQLGALTPASRGGAALTDARVRAGSWSCDAQGCAPGSDARIELPARGARTSESVRVVIAYAAATPGSSLFVDGETYAIESAEGQLSFVRSGSASAARFRVSASKPVSLIALAVVPARAELPPPAPEPWDAGAEDPSLPDASTTSASTSLSRPSR